jgi:uncharacterized protein (TIGR02453 family)
MSLIKPELFQFLRELKVNNNREWFQANKHRYENDLKEPLLDFIAAFGERLPEISTNYQAIPSITRGSLFRIYRDVRFSKDKTPYKTGAGLHFRHKRGKDVHAPGFYLHLEPGNVYAGIGIWRPESATLSKIRAYLDNHPQKWLEVIQGDEFQSTFSLGGESLKRHPRDYPPDHPLIEDLKRKDYIASAKLSEEIVCQEDFLDQYVELCRKSAPFMQFLAEAVGLDW